MFSGDFLSHERLGKLPEPDLSGRVFESRFHPVAQFYALADNLRQLAFAYQLGEKVVGRR